MMSIISDLSEVHLNNIFLTEILNESVADRYLWKIKLT